MYVRRELHALTQVGFNLEVGGYFSIKRNAVSFDGDTFVRSDQVVNYCKGLLEVFRCPPSLSHISASDCDPTTGLVCISCRCVGAHL
jgi:hypothetical protein